MKLIAKTFEMPFRIDGATTKQDIHNSFRSYLVMEHSRGKAAGWSIPLPSKEQNRMMVDFEGKPFVRLMYRRLFIALIWG